MCVDFSKGWDCFADEKENCLLFSLTFPLAPSRLPSPSSGFRASSMINFPIRPMTTFRDCCDHLKMQFS